MSVEFWTNLKNDLGFKPHDLLLKNKSLKEKAAVLFCVKMVPDAIKAENLLSDYENIIEDQTEYILEDNISVIDEIIGSKSKLNTGGKASAAERVIEELKSKAGAIDNTGVEKYNDVDFGDVVDRVYDLADTLSAKVEESKKIK